jgi:glycosyltransferase involved in cell wall biosynthesis
MKVGVNSLFLKPNQVGGAEFMLRGLLIGLARIRNINIYVFVNQDSVHWFNTLDLDVTITIISVKIIGNRFISEACQLPIIANKYHLDGLINTNYFTPWRLLLKMPCATVIHDLNYLHFPSQFSLLKKLWLRLAHRITLTNADIVVAISQFVKIDIQNKYKLSHKITMIYNPIAWDRLEIDKPSNFEDLNKFNQPFILSVANHYQHKNLATLVKAFSKLPEHLREIKLVLVGQLPDSLLGMRRDRCDDIRQLVKDLGLESRVYITGYISDRELAWYYHHAYLFAFPSLFEGFGMPPVEAMGMGLPVLTTRCTAIPEVTMQRAVYVENPLDVDEWRDRLTDMLNHREQYLPDQLLIQTIRQTYDPVAIAKKYVDLFRST